MKVIAAIMMQKALKITTSVTKNRKRGLPINIDDDDHDDVNNDDND